MASLALGLSACATVGPDFTTPALTPTPEAYAMAGEVAADAVRLDPQTRVAGPWWRAFGSEALDQTVRLALAQSPGVAEAKATLERYQAEEQAAQGARRPSAQVEAKAQRQKFNSRAFGFPGFPSRTFSLFSLGSSVSYDLDVFGGGRRRVEAASALTERAARQADAAYLSLSGNVALQAMRMAGLQAEIAALKRITDDDRALLDLAQKSLALGGVPRATVTLVEAQLAEDEAIFPPLQREYDAARHRLALLAGQAPGAWAPPDFDLDQMSVPADVPVSLPSSLVRRRPDILAAEADLHAATAAVGVTIADQYPDIRLSANGALSALTPGSVFSKDSTGWNLLSGVAAPLFDGGVRKARRKVAEAEARGAQARYQRTVLQAFTEVSDAMAALSTDQQRLETLQRAVTATDQQARDAVMARRLGSGTVLQAIQARRQLAQDRRTLAAARAQRLSDMVMLFAASAADWRDPQTTGGAVGVSPGH